jgi:rubrerythrin
MSLMAVLDEAIELEDKIRSCYEILSRSTEDGISDELRELARDEKSHANVLKTGKSFVIRTPDLVGQEKVSAAGIYLGLKTIAALEDSLKNGKTGLREGLKRLRCLERKFERVHLNTAVEFKDYALRKLFEALARADAEHRQRLERLISRL